MWSRNWAAVFVRIRRWIYMVMRRCMHIRPPMVCEIIIPDLPAVFVVNGFPWIKLACLRTNFLIRNTLSSWRSLCSLPCAGCSFKCIVVFLTPVELFSKPARISTCQPFLQVQRDYKRLVTGVGACATRKPACANHVGLSDGGKIDASGESQCRQNTKKE